MTPDSSPPAEPAVIGRYQVVRTIGQVAWARSISPKTRPSIGSSAEADADRARFQPAPRPGCARSAQRGPAAPRQRLPPQGRPPSGHSRAAPRTPLASPYFARTRRVDVVGEDAPAPVRRHACRSDRPRQAAADHDDVRIEDVDDRRERLRQPPFPRVERFMRQRLRLRSRARRPSHCDRPCRHGGDNRPRARARRETSRCSRAAAVARRPGPLVVVRPRQRIVPPLAARSRSHP